MNRTFDDGRGHFIIIRKDDKELAVDFIYSASDPFDENLEVVITEYPEFGGEVGRGGRVRRFQLSRNVVLFVP